jgi:allantoicase
MHIFEEEVIDAGAVSHVRLDIYPDGGVSRLRLLGEWYE